MSAVRQTNGRGVSFDISEPKTAQKTALILAYDRQFPSAKAVNLERFTQKKLNKTAINKTTYKVTI